MLTCNEAVIVGDDIDSDVRGGQAIGLTGVLVKTGKYRSGDLETEGPAPDHVIDDIGSVARTVGRVRRPRVTMRHCAGDTSALQADGKG